MRLARRPKPVEQQASGLAAFLSFPARPSHRWRRTEWSLRGKVKCLTRPAPSHRRSKCRTREGFLRALPFSKSVSCWTASVAARGFPRPCRCSARRCSVSEVGQEVLQVRRGLQPLVFLVVLAVLHPEAHGELAVRLIVRALQGDDGSRAVANAARDHAGDAQIKRRAPSRRPIPPAATPDWRCGPAYRRARCPSPGSTASSRAARPA